LASADVQEKDARNPNTNLQAQDTTCAPPSGTSDRYTGYPTSNTVQPRCAEKQLDRQAVTSASSTSVAATRRTSDPVTHLNPPSWDSVTDAKSDSHTTHSASIATFADSCVGPGV